MLFGNNTTQNISAQRLKIIRPYVDFNYDLRKKLTEYQKRKIKKYFDEIDALKARPYQIYKPRIKKRLKIAQAFAQHENNLRGLKVAFIPNNGHTVKILFNKKNEINVKSEYVSTRLIYLDKKELIKNPVEYTDEMVKKNTTADRFTILAGRYEIPTTYSRELIATYVGKYVASDKYSDKNKNNYFGNWLHGIAAHTFSNQSDFNDYVVEKQKNKEKLHKKRRLAKRRASYAKYGK